MKHLSVLFVALLLIGCQTTRKAVSTTASTADSFSFELIEQSIEAGQNVFLSPASAAMALRMLIPGADGQTLSELEMVVPNVDISSSEQLQIASAVWINKDMNVKSAFLDANADAEIYHGTISAQKVNQWASDKTHGKITEVVQEPLQSIQMILTNALYFQADWLDPFRKSNTNPDTFHGKSGDKQVDMMHQTTHFPFVENQHLQAVRLYYDAPYCMDIYLPRDGQTLASIIDEISKIDLGQIEDKKVELSLPKVRLDYEVQLNDYLKKMGLKSCFSSNADFSRLSDTPLYVDFIKQNTFLRIDEAGTEAAAVSTIGMAKMAFRPEPEEVYPMNVNRPFLLIIRHVHSKQILFFGIIYDILA